MSKGRQSTLGQRIKVEWKRNGFYGIVRKTMRRVKGEPAEVALPEWNVLTHKEIEVQKSKEFTQKHRFSILVPLYNTPIHFLKEMVDSVASQTYSEWELCLADGSDEEHGEVGDWCRAYTQKDSRVKYRKLEENRGISDNTNACMDMATGDFIALFDHDDLLTPDALYEAMEVLEKNWKVDVIYTDEDKINSDSTVYSEPHFKSDFNIDLLRSNNYICHFFMVRKEIVDKVGGLRTLYNGSQDYDFIFRCVEQARVVYHIPKVLYHWRMHENSTAANPESKMYCYDAGKRAIESHLERMGVEAKVSMTDYLGFYRVKYPVKGEPLVSIIIPNKDEATTLNICLHSILEKTTYKNYEIIIVENNSTNPDTFAYYDTLEKYKNIKVVEWLDNFNYPKINHYGISHSKGEYLIFLNNDTEILTSDWIEELLGNCQRPEVGITGAKLYYPDDKIQHAGVIVGLGGVAGHAFSCHDRKDPGYFARAIVQQDLSAVTAACFMVSRKIYDEVGGMEIQLQVAFNDVDFCLKVRDKGYLVVYNPNVELYHYESKSRGFEDTPRKHARFEREVNFMKARWEKVLSKGDPYYNPNLTLVRGDFSPK